MNEEKEGEEKPNGSIKGDWANKCPKCESRYSGNANICPNCSASIGKRFDLDALGLDK